MAPHALLHVVQASFGDTLLLEYEPVRTKDSKTVQFMLIDGGPPKREPHYGEPSVGTPKHNLISFLNWLSGSDATSKPEWGCLQDLETVVLTHDDFDHKDGIQALFASLIATHSSTTDSDTIRNTWIKGYENLQSGKYAVRHIWYNSLSNVSVFQGKAPQDGWFDLQLNALKNPKPASFNDEFAPSAGTTTLIMRGTKASGSSSDIVKGQFTFTFYGPLEAILRKDKLREELGGPKSIEDPKYSPDAALDKKSETLATHFLNQATGLATYKALKRSVDAEAKNLSSIAFSAGSTDGTSVLLLGDALAGNVFPPPTAHKFTIMKVMHHGSRRNNFWNRTTVRETEEGGLPSNKATAGLEKIARCAVYFFAKIKADKYVISASSLSPKPNPHIVTLLGIFGGARENDKDVDIYLTNPLGPWTVDRFGDFLRSNGYDIKRCHLWLLNHNVKFGSVAVYSHETDSGWEEYSGSAKDLWTTYSDQVKNDFASTATLNMNLHRIIPKRKPGIIPPTAAALIYPTGGPIIAPGYILLPTDLSTPPYPTKTLPDFASTLGYLVDQNAITSTQAQQVMAESMKNDGLLLVAVAALFMGVVDSETFLASLPCDLQDSNDFLTSDISPYHWTVKGFTAEIIDSSHGSQFKGWRGIYSVAFSIIPRQEVALSWKIPFGTASPNQISNSYQLLHDGAVSTLILWPSYRTRTVFSDFKGTLQLSGTVYHVTGQLQVFYKQPVRYIMKFSDDKYSTENYTVPIGDLLQFFNSVGCGFGSRLSQILLPGLQLVLQGLDDRVALRHGGFVLERILSKVFLKEVSAYLPFDNIPAWQPFGSTNFSLSVSGLRVALDNIGSDAACKLQLQLSGDMKYPDPPHDDATVPFRFTAEFTRESFMLYEVSILPGNDDSIPVSQLLRIIGAASSFDLSDAFPAISNLSNALSISNVTVGWTNGVIPDYMTLGILVDDWTVLENVLSIRHISLEVQAANLSSTNPTQLSLHGHGILEISDVEVEVYLNISHNYSKSVNDLITFEIATRESAIPLGSIITHFFGGDFILFPDKFVSLLNETNIDNFTIQALHDATGWAISQLKIGITIAGSLDISDKFDVSHPTLLIDIEYPFNKEKRTIYSSIEAAIGVGHSICTAEIVFAAADTSQICVLFKSEPEPLTPQAVLSCFIPDWPETTLSLPPSVSFLLDIGIGQGSLGLDITDGKYTISEITLTVLSTQTLTFWNEITLERLSLFFGYSKSDGKRVEFSAMLSFANGGFLDFTVLYDGSSTSSAPTTKAISDRTANMVGNDGGSWHAIATYDDTISLLDILSRVSGLDIRKELNSLSLSVLSDVLDIDISRLTVTLLYSPSKKSFSFDADTTWLFFSHLRVSCSKSTSWSYSYGFDVSPDINIIEKIPFLGSAIGDIVSFTNVSVAVFNNELDKGVLSPELHLPDSSSITQAGLNVAFSGKLGLGGKLAGLSNAVGNGSIDIIGIIGDEFISLSVSTKAISLFNGSMSISGAVIVICSKTNLQIGIQGDAVLDFGPHVSKNAIKTTLFLFVNTSTAALGFRFTLDKWESVFGFDGLNFKDVIFSAEFPPEQFPVPSAFTIQGTVDLQVNDAHFDGSVSIHFVEVDLTESYAMGNINGLTLNNIVSAFTSADEVPDFLDLGFGPLSFKIVPKDIYDHGKLIKQEFAMKGSMHIKPINFDASVDIDITSSKVFVEGYISPIIVLNAPKLFSIVASPEQNPPPPAGSGASIHISVGAGATPPFSCFISGKITFLGLSNDIYFDLSPNGLAFTLDRDWIAHGSVSGVVDSTHLELSASAELSLHFTLPSISIGSVYFGDINIATFSATFDVQVNWSKPSWNLSITGSFEVFGRKMEKSLNLGMDVQDLSALISGICESIKSTFVDDFLSIIHGMLDDLQAALAFLKRIGLAISDMIRFLTETCGVAMSEVLKAIREFFESTWEELASILHKIGTIAEDVVKFFKDLGCEIGQIATSLARAFGSAVRDLCGKILHEAECDIKEIAKFFQDEFNDPPEAVIDMLFSLDFGPFSIIRIIILLFGLSWSEVWHLIHGSSKKRTTRDQVQEELLLLLAQKASQKLTKPVDVTDANQLPDILHDYAMIEFKERLSYEYAGGSTVATVLPLPLSTPPLRGLASMLYITDDTIASLPNFVDSIIGGVDLASWARAPARGDLLHEVQVLFGLPKDNEWDAVTIRQSYDPPDGDGNTIVTNAVIVYVNGSLIKDTWDVTQTTMYYMGVYFCTLNPIKVAKDYLRRLAYERAGDLTNNTLSVIDDASLGTALESHGQTAFTGYFHFDYLSKPPGTPEDGHILDEAKHVLGYFEDSGDNTIESFVKEHIFSQFSIPDWVKDNAIPQFVELCRSAIGTGGTFGIWETSKIENTYTHDPTANSVKCKAIITHYTDTETTDNSKKVQIGYIFILGVFYEVIPVEVMISADLLKLLYTNIIKDLHETPDSSVTPTVEMLASSLERYAKTEFLAKYLYDYRGDLTTPTDMVAQVQVYATQVLHQFKGGISVSETSTFVNTICPGGKYPLFDQVPAIRTDMARAIAEMIKGIDNVYNEWSCTPFSKAYSHPNDPTKLINSSAIFIYTNGLLSEVGDVVKSTIFFYIGVHYLSDAPSIDDW